MYMHILIPPTAMLTLCFRFPLCRSVWAAGGSALPAAAPCQPPWGQHLPPGHVWGEKPPLTGQGKTKKPTRLSHTVVVFWSFVYIDPLMFMLLYPDHCGCQSSKSYTRVTALLFFINACYQTRHFISCSVEDHFFAKHVFFKQYLVKVTSCNWSDISMFIKSKI